MPDEHSPNSLYVKIGHLVEGGAQGPVAIIALAVIILAALWGVFR